VGRSARTRPGNVPAGAGRRARSKGTDEPLWVCDRRAVAEAIRAGMALEVRVGPGARSMRELRGLLEGAEREGVRVRTTSARELEALDPRHQGVAAVVRRPELLSERALSEPGRFGSEDVVVVLDGVVDPQNVGAAARAAEGAGCALLVVRERRAAGITPGAIRASAGALLMLSVASVPNLSRALERLKDNGFFVVGLDGEAEASVYDEPCPEGRVALVVGSEGEGLSRLVGEHCDLLVRLPMRGALSSLNASAALAAALWSYLLPSRSGEG
jgi:23S rRNA (guanosine2251-2'-O)-methyltransferase